MRKILVLLTVFCLAACTKWEELELINGELTVRLLNVEVTFLYKEQKIDTSYLYTEQEIEALNQNYGGAEVKVSRRVNWSDYTEIFNRWIPGRSEVLEKVYFKRDDKIKLYVSVDNRDEEDPERWSYFQLKSVAAEKSLAAEIFPGRVPKNFELRAGPDDGSLILEFTLD